MTFSFAPLSYTLPYWPEHLFGHPDFLDRVGISEFRIASAPGSLSMSGKVALLDPIETKLPALDGVTVAFFPDATGTITEIPMTVGLAPAFAVSLDNLVVELRIQSDLLHAVKHQGTDWVPLVDAQNQPKPVAVKVSGASVKVSADGDIDVTGNPTITMTAIAIGDSGIVVEIHGVTLHLSDSAPPLQGAPPGFKGVAIDAIAVHLGDAFEGFGGPDNITASKLFIGSSGFTGEIAATWSNPPTSGKLLGLAFQPVSIGIEFAQNKLTGMTVKGKLTLPFFESDLNVTVGYDAEGGLSIAIDSTDGLFTLTKPGFLEVEVDSLQIVANGKKALVKISGKMTPLYGNFAWPSFELRELSIDSDGHVKLDGGWIDLPKQASLNFNGFTLEITKFGLGKTDGGGRWVGFSATVNLIKGIKGKASVDGLRIIIRENGTIGIALEGVGVDMKLAGAFELKGDVKFKDDSSGQRFDGAALLALKKPELIFDTELTIGRVYATTTAPEFKYFGMYGGIELPTGIPFGPISIYGFAGLLALQMRPDRHTGEPWYALPPGDSWYHRGTPGVRPLMTKWGPKKDAYAFGAGLTIGTTDNGFTFNARALLVLAFPGPLLMIEGRGNLLKERKALSGSEEPLFRALAVLDFDAGEFTFGLDAYYKYGAGGEVIEIRGSLEAYYNRNDPRLWHIWLGKDEPRESRIQAKIISVFEANAYFMIDAQGLKTGAWIGYDKSWNPSPLSITLQAWLDANAAISVKPNHFHADPWLHAAIELSAFGVGAGLSADARLDADIKDPFHIKGELTVTLELPWPLKDISKDVTVEWGPRPADPPIPIVLGGAGVEHPKSSTVWRLEIGKSIVPSFDDGNGYLGAPHGSVNGPASVVAMDARPAIAFARPVHDDALVGVNGLAPVPEYEQIGDPSKGQGPAKVRFALKSVILEKSIGSGWVQIAGKGAGADALDPLYGSWGTIPSGNDPDAVEQTKLYLWSRTPFVQTRHTGDDWNDWFAGAYPHYPCPGGAPLDCYDFDGYEVFPVMDGENKTIPDQVPHRRNPALQFYTQHGWQVEQLSPPVNGHARVLRPHVVQVGPAGTLASFCALFIDPTLGATCLVRVRFDTKAERYITLYEIPSSGGTVTSRQFMHNGVELVLLSDMLILGVAVTMLGVVGIVEICLGADDKATAQSQLLSENIKNATSVWSAQGEVLEPYTDYRLAIVTEVDVVGAAGSGSQLSYAHFTTGGPPGLGGFSVPEGQTVTSVAAGPDNLATYVRQTVPATIGRDEQAPAMPRPVFRAYDIGIEFNADYVDLLYRLAHRDLTVQILDSNGAPARDAKGAALSFENPWGVTSDLVLDKAELDWLAMVDPDCMPIDQTDIARNQTLGTAGTPLLLDPTTRYRARLVPLLVHDDFAAPRRSHADQTAPPGERIGEWHVAEFESVSPSSRWTIDNAGSVNGVFVIQDRAVAGSANAATLCPPGSALLWSPASGPLAKWKSQRVALFVAGAAGGAAGVVLLHTGAQDYFAVTLHEAASVCRLVRRTGAGAAMLAEAPCLFPTGTDTELVVEVGDGGIRVFANGAAVLTHKIDLSHHLGGETGLWCWNNPAARFKDVRIEDQSGKAANAFDFEFVTSAYVNFFHLASARRTPVWDIETEGGSKERSAAELALLSDTAGTSVTAPLAAPEVRQYDDLASLWLGPGLVRDPDAPEVNRILRGGEVLGWLVRSPEPWDWKRAEITLMHCADAIPASELLGPVKITGAALGMTAGDDEYVDLLGLEDVDLLGWKLQLRDGSGTTSGLVDTPFDDDGSNWLDLHTFAAGGHINAGIRLRVYSGGLVRPPLGHTHRTFNCVPAGDPGVARLPAAGADLRLIDPIQRTACAVRILPQSAFAPIAQPPRMLRKGDAAGLIVLPSSGAQIASGAYALAMRYCRDARSIDPDSVILSEAGSTADEAAFVLLH
jgi:hypothetical protein